MPPVMGAGAFILATWTNIPYARVALAAAIPAILYYAALLWAIHFRATKVGLKGSVAARGGRSRAERASTFSSRCIIIVVMLALGTLADAGRVLGGRGVAGGGVRMCPATRPGRGEVAHALRKAASGRGAGRGCLRGRRDRGRGWRR